MFMKGNVALKVNILKKREDNKENLTNDEKQEFKRHL